MGVQQRTALTACVGHVMRTNLFKFASPQLLTDGYHVLVLGAERKGPYAGRRRLHLRHPPPSLLLIHCVHTQNALWDRVDMQELRGVPATFASEHWQLSPGGRSRGMLACKRRDCTTRASSSAIES